MNKLFLKISQISKTPLLDSFLIKMQALRPSTLFDRDSNTGVFLTMLQSF